MSLSFGNLPFGADLGVPPAVSTTTFDLSQAAYEGQFADVIGAHLLRQVVAADSVVRLRVTGTELKVSCVANLAGYVELSLDGGATYDDPVDMTIGSDTLYTVYTGLSDIARDVVIRGKFGPGQFYLDARPDSTFVVTGVAPACVPDPTAASYTQYVLNATATDAIGRAGILNGVRLEEGYATGTVSNPAYTAVQVGVTALGSDGLATNYLMPCQVRLRANVTDIAIWTYLDGQAKFALIADEVIGASVTVPNTGHWGRFVLATGLSGTHTYGLCCAYMAPTNYGFGSGAIYSIHTKGGTGIDTTSRPAARPKLVLPGDSIWGNQVSLDAASTVNDGTLKWALPLAERLHMEFVNLGIGSTTLRDFSGDPGGGGVGAPYNTAWSGEARITHDLTGLSLPAGSIVLVGGWTNDYGQAFYQSGAGVPLETEAQYRGACDRFLTRLLAVVGTGVPVYWAGITPRGPATFVGFTPQPRSEWNQQQIDAIAANGSPNVEYIETADANLAGPTETDFTTNFMDNLHWNQAGCAVMVDFFYPILAGGGTPTPTPTVSTFIKGVNFNDTLPPIVLAVPHAAGAPSLVLTTGAGARLGTLPPNRFFRVTALRNPGTANEVVLGIYKATGIDVPGDTLTGVTGAEGFANVAQPAGVTLEVRDTAQDYEDHSSAINALEATVAAFAPPTGSLTALQIQALIDARAGTGKAVILPAGTHYLDRPLRISQGSTTLLGDPGGGTILATLKSGGMPTILVGPVLTPAPVLFDGQFSRWVNLRDTRGGDIDGLTSLSIAFDFNLTSLGLTDDDQVFLSSGGSRQDFGGEYTESLRLSLFNGALKGKLTTVSGVTLLSTSMATGPRHVEFSYDGSTVRLRVDGSGPSASATGAIVQGFYEDFAVGSALYRWPDAISLSRPVTGVMTNFVMNGSGTGNPLFEIPSFVGPGQLIPCDTRWGPATLMLRKDGNGTASIQHCRIADLQVVADQGHGIFMTQTQATILERLTLTGRQPLTMWNNAYSDTIRDLNLYAWAVGSRYGLGLIGGTINNVRNLIVSITGPGGVGIVANSASGNFENCFVTGGTMKLGFLAKSDGGFNRWSNSTVTDENQSVPGEAALLFSGIDTVLVDGGGSYALSSPHPVAILSHCKTATFVGHHLGATATTAELLAITACGPVHVLSCPVVPAGVPYGDGADVDPPAVAYDQATATLTVGAPATAQDPTIDLDNPATNHPVIRWTPTNDNIGIRFLSGTAEIARIQDNGYFFAANFATTGGFYFNSDFSIVRSQKLVFDYPDAAFDFAGGGTNAWTTWVRIRPNQPTTVGLDMQAVAGQSAPLVRWLAADGTTVLASVGPTGSLTAADQFIANAAPGSLPVTLAGYLGDLNTSSIWFADVPNGSNYAFRGNRGGGTWLNASVLIQLRIADTTRVEVRSDKITWNGPADFNTNDNSNHALAIDTEATVDLDGTRRNVEVVATRPDARPLVVIGAPSQTAALFPLRGISSTSDRRDLGYLDAGFVVNTDASYTGYLSFRAQDFGNNTGSHPAGWEFLRGSTDGTQALVGAYGATPVARPSGDVAAGLAALGWMAAPTYAASGLTGTVAIAKGGTGATTAAAGFNALSPITTTGDLIYGSAANTAGRLAGPTSATKQFLTSTGTGSVAQAPAWGPVSSGDVSGLGTSATHASTDYLLAANNLSDVTATTARTNLGLGTAATHPDTDFLTPTGSGSGLTALNASALASGTVPMARLPAANGSLTATVTTTSSTLGTNALTNLGFAIGANEVWTVEWNLTVTGSTAGMKFDVTGPASPAHLRVTIEGNTSAITAKSVETITAFSTASAAYVLYSTTCGRVQFVACIANGANAGTVQLRFGAATNTQSNSVLIDSYMTARRTG